MTLLTNHSSKSTAINQEAVNQRLFDNPGHRKKKMTKIAKAIFVFKSLYNLFKNGFKNKLIKIYKNI